jgi:hypothetical protein
MSYDKIEEYIGEGVVLKNFKLRVVSAVNNDYLILVLKLD